MCHQISYFQSKVPSPRSSCGSRTHEHITPCAAFIPSATSTKGRAQAAPTCQDVWGSPVQQEPVNPARSQGQIPLSSLKWSLRVPDMEIPSWGPQSHTLKDAGQLCGPAWGGLPSHFLYMRPESWDWWKAWQKNYLVGDDIFHCQNLTCSISEEGKGMNGWHRDAGWRQSDSN